MERDGVKGFKTIFPEQRNFTFALMGMDDLYIARNQKTKCGGFIDSINKHKSYNPSLPIEL